MNHIFRSIGRAAILFGALGMGAGACTDSLTGFFIQGNVALVAPACSARADATVATVGTGRLDVALRLDYVATLLVGSQLAPRADKANLRSETMITNITGAEVQLYTDTGELDTEFTVPASGIIPPSGSADPGFGIIEATLIPAATGLALANELTSRSEVRTRVAQVKVFGETLGGEDVESAEFPYVIRVCEGCMIEFPPADLDGNRNCVGVDTNPEPPCHVGQDDLIPCTACVAYNDFCANPADVF
jgi:hypothetical protein